ncbi:hypothetical protein O6H91_21G052000 [Diphasiastrum complanatum]|uniref:Uncharacterized protein n=1 Tax=Diphasiastrum complanatum TaxID=34168 RepID=A0ACC2AKR2_DIPCM|nr:hypothetical protein O6H91_21G052000 [Diphasiastrum complanatum]
MAAEMLHGARNGCAELLFSGSCASTAALLTQQTAMLRFSYIQRRPLIQKLGVPASTSFKRNGFRLQQGSGAQSGENTRLQSLFEVKAQGQVSATGSAIVYDSSILQEVDSELDETRTIVFKDNAALTVTIRRADANAASSSYKVLITVPFEGMILHWAMNNWSLPNNSWWPSGSTQVTEAAVETPFSFISKSQWQDKDGEWYNNDGCFEVSLKSLQIQDLIDQVRIPETSFENWSLFNRFILASELLDAAESLGAEGMAFVFTWLRFSALKQLTWHRNCNYQSKDIAHVQKSLATLMAKKVIHGKSHKVRHFARLSLETLPRGGGDAEQIRMGILHIMRENGIREGHRPGIEERFLEQWHQKLHTNSTQEDIHICEAYIQFLHTNNIDDFYRVLWENGSITREWLEKMDHPITAHPMHLPHLIPFFQHFLWVLKMVHSGADLDVMLEMSKGSLTDELKGMLYDICSNRDAWWVPGKVVEARKKLEKVWRVGSVNRDLLLLDIALDKFVGVSLGRIDKTKLSGDDLCELISLVLENSCITIESEELSMCMDYWRKVVNNQRWTKEWAFLALAAMERLSLALEGIMDDIYNLVQPKAEMLGIACHIRESYIKNFGEEVVRSQTIFNLSIFLKKLQPHLQDVAGWSSWQIVSHQPFAQGTLMVLPSLASIQGHKFSVPHIVVTSTIGGMEDIPQGVTAVLSSDAIDILSHVAIRARNNQVLLASCFDGAIFDELKSKEGESLHLKVDTSGQLVVSRNMEDLPEDPNNTHRSISSPTSKFPSVINPEVLDWVITEEDFQESHVGGKSINIARLRTRLPTSIQLPISIALPFGVFEKVLNDSLNSSIEPVIRSSIEKLQNPLQFESVSSELKTIRHLVSTRLMAPKALQKAIISKAESSGIIKTGCWDNPEIWRRVWHSICQTWASKWTDRAWLSRNARGHLDGKLFMACLLQKVVPAEYAFVLHTVHPISKDPSVMLCEVVAGLGEALVSNQKGRAFSFTIDKSLEKEETLLSLPSKQSGFFAPEQGTFIARSDSNGEDLENFAGAGLYDSKFVELPNVVMIDYNKERLIWDSTFRDYLVRGISALGLQVEAAFSGQAQDIEGVYCNGNFTVVQSRPQIVN